MKHEFNRNVLDYFILILLFVNTLVAGLENRWVFQLFAVPLSLGLFMFIKGKGNKLIIKDFVSYAMIAFMGWQLISVFTSDKPMMSWWGSSWRREGYMTYLFYMILFVYGRMSNGFTPKFKKMIYIISGIVFVVSAFQWYGLINIPGAYYGKEPNILGKYYRIYATSGNPNFLGSLTVILLPFFTVDFLRKRNNISLFMTFLILVVSFATFTRGAWIGILVFNVGFLIMMWLKRKNMKISKMRIIAYVSVILLAFPFFNKVSEGEFMVRLATIKETATNITEDESGSGRVGIWKKSIKMISYKPVLGHGMDATWDLYPKFLNQYDKEAYGGDQLIDRAHNELLQIGVSSGVMAMILYVVFAGSIWFKSFSIFLKRDDIDDDQMMMLLVVFGYVAQGMFNISATGVVPIYWVMLGMLAKNNDDYKKKLLTTDIELSGTQRNSAEFNKML